MERFEEKPCFMNKELKQASGAKLMQGPRCQV